MNELRNARPGPSKSEAAVPPGRIAAIARAAGLLLLLAALVLLAVKLPILRWLVAGAGWARNAGARAVLVAIAAIVVATLLFAPIWPLMILSGWVFRAWGVPISIIAAVLSAVSAFSISRALCRTAFARMLRRLPKVAKVFALADSGGLLTVALLRIAPVVPFTAGNALLGLTKLTVRDMAIGTPLGLFPAAIFYAWIGVLLPDASAIEHGQSLEVLSDRKWILTAVFVGHAVIALLFAWLARRHAQKLLAKSSMP